MLKFDIHLVFKYDLCVYVVINKFLKMDSVLHHWEKT